MIMPNTASAIVCHVSKHPFRLDFYIYMPFKDNFKNKKNKKALQESTVCMYVYICVYIRTYPLTLHPITSHHITSQYNM